MSPTRIDFYLLQNNEPQERWLIACKLIEKAYLRDHKIFVYCNNQQDAEKIDELLWTFKDESFIPHNLQGEGPEPPPPVQIGFIGNPRGFNDILLNLADEVPAFYSSFRRVIELVVNDENAKNQSRMHYKTYKANACQLYTHSL